MVKEVEGQDLLYKQFAKYYDLLYSKVLDHKEVAKTITKLAERYGKSDGRDLLDIGCGTGADLFYLRRKFNCTGVDINVMMLAIAKRNVRGVRFLKGDMQNLILNKRFDVITILGSAIGYAITYANLKKVFRTISRHLKPGGITIIEPWIEKGDFISGYIDMDTYNSNNLKLARVSYSKKKGSTSIVEFGFLIAEKNKGITYLKDVAVDGLFEDAKIIKMMGAVGLDACVIKNVKGSYRGRYIVGTKAV